MLAVVTPMMGVETVELLLLKVTRIAFMYFESCQPSSFETKGSPAIRKSSESVQLKNRYFERSISVPGALIGSHDSSSILYGFTISGIATSSADGKSARTSAYAS